MEKFFDQKLPSAREAHCHFPRRWAFIGKILIVHANFEQVTFLLCVFRFLFLSPKLTFPFFSIFQAYFASGLNTPHYQIGASDLFSGEYQVVQIDELSEQVS
jgi:hypothetical protein